MKALSVVVLNWNSIELLDRCLSSLSDHCAGFGEIIVVDNGSDDQEAVSRLAGRFGVDVFIPLPSNVGVAKGRNIGLAAATCSVLCVLDVDTEVTEGALQRCLQRALDYRVGIVGPRLVDRNGETQLTCRRIPTVLTQVFRRFPRFDYWGVLAEYELRAVSHSVVISCGYVIGACQVFRREVFLAYGPYREFSRFGYEDTDLCLRCWRAGLRVVYEPEATIYHLERRVARKWSAGLTYDHLFAMARFFVEHRYLFRPPRFKNPNLGDDGELGVPRL